MPKLRNKLFNAGLALVLSGAVGCSKPALSHNANIDNYACDPPITIIINNHRRCHIQYFDRYNNNLEYCSYRCHPCIHSEFRPHFHPPYDSTPEYHPHSSNQNHRHYYHKY